LDLTGKVVSVSPFSDQYEAMEDVPVATVATAYDCPTTGKTHILVINEALYFGDKMSNTLLCPNQLRANGIRVDDCPRQYNAVSTHSIHIPEKELTIPLSLHGVISGFATRLPTAEELARVTDHIELTADLEWDPYSHALSDKEAQAHDVDRTAMVVNRTNFCDDLEPHVELCITEKDDMIDRLVAAVRVPHSDHTEDHRCAKAVVRAGEANVITPEDVAKRWHIGLTAATKTLQVTTQLGVRILNHPAQRRFRTAMPHLRYPRLKGTWYADTMFFTTKSVRGFKCAHIIGNGLGYSRFMPLESKAETHLALTSFIHQNGIMEDLVVDGDPTMAFKEWRKTIREFRINQTTTEPYSPWQNRAELDVCEAKRAMRRFKKKTGSPRRLWFFWVSMLQLFAVIRLTTHPSFRGDVRRSMRLAIGKEATLEEDFLVMAFGDVFVKELKMSPGGWVDIPVGDYKPSHLHKHANLKVIGAPKVHFNQSDGKDLCVSKSLASALYSIGFTKDAVEVNSFGE
jgi:hypothetical protein